MPLRLPPSFFVEPLHIASAKRGKKLSLFFTKESRGGYKNFIAKGMKTKKKETEIEIEIEQK